MFCPQCGNKQSDELKFCKLCGANLFAVRQVVGTREADEKFDWSKTWVAEMFMSEAERKRRNADLERQRGVTPEIKRYNEIKAGVIVSSVGVGLVLLLWVIGGAIASDPRIPAGDGSLLRSLWVAGVIPFMVGLALIFNGLVISRKTVELQKRALGAAPESLPKGAEQPALKSADTSEFIPTGFSVTEGTTKHLTLKDER
ncbi:MAG TPA: zinc ribbon domain-containing protein [Pyrinomonadaceae bacterium]|jgi:hypothetical protein